MNINNDHFFEYNIIFLISIFASHIEFICDNEIRRLPNCSYSEILKAFNNAYDGFPFEHALPTDKHIPFYPKYSTIDFVSNGNIMLIIWGAFDCEFLGNPTNFVLGIFLVISLII